MIKIKILRKLIAQFITNHLPNLFKSFNKANFTINKTTPFSKINNKKIKLLPNLKIKMKKIQYKNEKIAFNLQSLSKLKVKQQSKILNKWKRDFNL